MGRRQQKRLRIALPVTVSGLDGNGNPFTQSATTVDVSPRGLHLRGIHCLRKRGDPVQVEYKGRRARYRVAWIGSTATCWEGAAGLEGLEGARLLFAEHLPAGSLPIEADTYEPAAAQAAADHAAVERREGDRRQQERRQEERRRHPRFNCAGTARIWENGNAHGIAGRLNEISIGGCYIEMMSPMRLSQGIRLELEVNNRTLRLEGIVRVSQQTFGMGVEFTRMAPSEAEKLHHIVAELSGQAPAEAPPAPETPRPDIVPGKELGEALLRWFGAHETLTRQDFLGLMQQLKRAAEEFTHV